MKNFIRISSALSFLKEENLLLFQSKKQLKTVKLEPQLSRLLYELVLLKNEVISKEDLIEVVWNGNEYVGNEALRKNIYKLRSLVAKVDLLDEVSIVTIPKRGYKLVVSEVIQIKKIRFSKALSYSIVASVLLFFSINLISIEEIEIDDTEDVFYTAQSIDKTTLENDSAKLVIIEKQEEDRIVP